MRNGVRTEDGGCLPHSDANGRRVGMGGESRQDGGDGGEGGGRGEEVVDGKGEECGRRGGGHACEDGNYGDGLMGALRGCKRRRVGPHGWD